MANQELKENILGWLQLDNDIKSLQKQIKEKRKEKETSHVHTTRFSPPRGFRYNGCPDHSAVLELDQEAPEVSRLPFH